jgi:hypothetical protein
LCIDDDDDDDGLVMSGFVKFSLDVVVVVEKVVLVERCICTLYLLYVN